MGVGRLARVSRVVRVVRLLRLVRMQEVLQNITERIQSDKTILGLDLNKLLAFLITCCHVTACGWWGLGTISCSGTNAENTRKCDKSWVSQYGYVSSEVG